MISQVNILANQKHIQVKINNQVINSTADSLILQLKEYTQRYFTELAKDNLAITYTLWTQAISFEELESNRYLEADCLEVFLDNQLQERKIVSENQLGKLLFDTIYALAIEAQKSQLLTKRFVTEQELGIKDWKVKNTRLGDKSKIKSWTKYLTKAI